MLDMPVLCITYYPSVLYPFNISDLTLHHFSVLQDSSLWWCNTYCGTLQPELIACIFFITAVHFCLYFKLNYRLNIIRKEPMWKMYMNLSKEILDNSTMFTLDFFFFFNQPNKIKHQESTLEHVHILLIENDSINRGAGVFPWCSWCTEHARSASSSSEETQGSWQPGECCTQAHLLSS